MFLLLIIVAVFTSNCYAGPVEATPDLLKSVCKDELIGGGLSKFFARNVAHRLHSLTLEDIQLYFKSDVTENNNIPTVNKDLKSDKRVLEYAPRTEYDNSFTTNALKYLDLILRDMDKKDYSITNFSVLEKIAHVFHMSELWNRASIHYRALLLQPPPPEICSCAANTYLNNINQELNLLALKIKYPGITSGEYDQLKDRAGLGYDVDYSFGHGVVAPPPGYDVHYTLGANKEPTASFQETLEKFDFTGEESDVVERVARDLVDGDHGMAKQLDSEEGWAYWKQKMQEMKEIGNYEFAVFMYCKFHQ